MATSAAVQTHHVDGLSFSRGQLEQRRLSLGASEIPAVAGLNPNRGPLAVWMEKRGLVAPFGGNEFTEWGLRLEGAIREKYMEVTGTHVEPGLRVGTRQHPAHEWMTATPDGLVIEQGSPTRGLEIKRFGEYRRDDFGVPGTDQIPGDVLAQVLWSMLVFDLPAWDVAVLLGQADFRIYTVQRDDELCASLFEIGHRFWHAHVLAGVEPPVDGLRNTHEALAQRFKTHTAILREATPETMALGQQLARVKADIKALEFSASELEAKLKLAIGETAGIEGIATWKAPKSGAVSWKSVAEALARAHGIPASVVSAIAAEHTSDPSRRFTLTLKEG